MKLLLIFFSIFFFSFSVKPSPVPPPIEEQAKSALDLFNESMSDFDNQINTINRSIYTSKPTYQIEVVYVIPNREKSRPRANEVIEEIFKIVQKHYYEQLGATFELKKPLITTIVTNLDNENEWTMKIPRQLIKNKGQLNRSYYDKKNIIFFVVEGNNGAGLGGYNMAQSGFLWRHSYETYIKDPNQLVNTIVGWSHELGHAFGLGHTKEMTAPCLARYGVKVGEFPPIVMQVSDGGKSGSVYNYPFISEEKFMLLDPDYYPECSINKGTGRPHASKFLKLKSIN